MLDKQIQAELSAGFISYTPQGAEMPRAIFSIKRDNDKVLKELEKSGVEIYSCGSCLSYYALTERLKVGMIGNALESMQNMLKSEGVVRL